MVITSTRELTRETAIKELSMQDALEQDHDDNYDSAFANARLQYSRESNRFLELEFRFRNFEEVSIT